MLFTFACVPTFQRFFAILCQANVILAFFYQRLKEISYISLLRVLEEPNKDYYYVAVAASGPNKEILQLDWFVSGRIFLSVFAVFVRT